MKVTQTISAICLEQSVSGGGFHLDDGVITISFDSAEDLARGEVLIREVEPELIIETGGTADDPALEISMTEDQIRARQDFAIQQNTTTLRNRVNELGVAEPVVQRQGRDRIVVQLPGVQDPAQAERILGATATLEFRLVCDGENAFEAQRRGRAPLGCELFHRSRRPAGPPQTSHYCYR